MILTVKCINNEYFELQSGQKHFIPDQYGDYGCKEDGPMPSELMLCSIASCFGQSMTFSAKKLCKSLGQLKVEVTGIKDGLAFSFDKIKITVHAETPYDDLKEIASLAKKYCYVTNSLHTPLEVQVASSV